MGIDAVHLNGAMTGVHDINVMKHLEEAKTVLDQTNYQNQFNQKVDNKLNQVQSKENMENRHQKMDAKDKGNGTYFGDGGQNRQKQDKEQERKATPHLGGGFDMKI